MRRSTIGLAVFTSASLLLPTLAPSIAIAQLNSPPQTSGPPPISPGWYSNSPGGTTIYQDPYVTIVWEHSYVYEVPKGSDPLSQESPHFAGLEKA